MLEFFKPNLENQLTNEINRMMENNHLDGILLQNYTCKDRCSGVCKIIEDELIKNYWYVSSRRITFRDFGDLVDSSPVSFHVFLVAMKNNRAFLVDPTFGQFNYNVPVFIHEITGKTNTAKNIDLCKKKLESLGLSDKVFSFFINQSLGFLNENDLLDELLGI